MFKNNGDFIPRTYSVKSFRRRKSINLKKVLIYFTFSVFLIAALGITFLSIAHLI